jgi:gamma-glutamyltranspeptidase/glutathione hydrolase
MKITYLILCLSLLVCYCNQSQNHNEEFQPGVIDNFILGQSNNAMVVSQGGSRPVQTGLDILNAGGNALDAVLATGMIHIVQNIGAAVSFGGTMSLIYYDAGTGRIHSVNAPFKNPFRETDPLTIPPQSSGRTALVPGFLAGVLEAHDRFGRIGRDAVFLPAIDLAENGFILSSGWANLIRDNYHILSRLPDTRRIFTKNDGSLYQANELFTQAELANTLKQVVRLGMNYLYKGQWARDFARIVQNDGGNLGIDDMESYRVSWNDAVHTTFNGYDIYSIGLPAHGGVGIIEAFNLIECSDLEISRHYTESARDLYQMIKIVRVGPLHRNFLDAENIAESLFPGSDFSQQHRLTKESANYTWSKITSGDWSEVELMAAGKIPATGSAHTAAEIVVDADGNVAAMVHTINTSNWGQTGIFAGGISIPDIGYGARYAMEIEGPGGYHYDDIFPSIVLRAGRPVLACGAAGYGLHCDTVQNMYNILAHGCSLSESLSRHRVLWADWGAPYSYIPQLIWRDSFSPDILDQIRDMGQYLRIVSQQGLYWSGIKIGDSNSDYRLQGATILGAIDGF